MENLIGNLDGYLAAGSSAAYIAVFMGGILISFTPCVYPLLPITIGYIGAASGGNKAKGFLLSVFYVLGMAVTYAALGAIAALTGRLFGQIQTNPISYFIVANICILLGLSMLDAYNLPMPKFLSGLRPKGKVGGIFSSFFIGLVSGLIVGPCTAPALGALLFYVGSKQNLFYGITLLFTFALGMGLLLIVVGTLSGAIASLPKAGIWMVRIKKAFGLLLIAAGEYFLILMGKMLI